MTDRRRVVILLVLVAIAVAAPFVVNAVVRPGCSLLPVALPEDGTGGNATPEQACAALGRSLPDAALKPDGVRRAEIAVDSVPPFGAKRFVHVSYVKDGRRIALLSIVPGNFPSGNVNEVNGTLAGAPAVIGQMRRSNMEFDDVSYLWARDGLLFSLHVALAPGITREAADAMAASVR